MLKFFTSEIELQKCVERISFLEKEISSMEAEYSTVVLNVYPYLHDKIRSLYRELYWEEKKMEAELPDDWNESITQLLTV